MKYWIENRSQIIKFANQKVLKSKNQRDVNRFVKSRNAIIKIDMQVFLDKKRKTGIRLATINNIILPSAVNFLDTQTSSNFRFLNILHTFSHLDSRITRVNKTTFDIKSHFICDFLLYSLYSQDEILLIEYLLENQVNFLFKNNYSISNFKKTSQPNRLGRELILFVFCTLFVTKRHSFSKLEQEIRDKFKSMWQYLRITELDFNVFNMYLLDGLNLLSNPLSKAFDSSCITKIKFQSSKVFFTQEFGDILFSDKLELEKMSQISSFVLKSVIPLLE